SRNLISMSSAKTTPSNSSLNAPVAPAAWRASLRRCRGARPPGRLRNRRSSSLHRMPRPPVFSRKNSTASPSRSNKPAPTSGPNASASRPIVSGSKPESPRSSPGSMNAGCNTRLRSPRPGKAPSPSSAPPLSSCWTPSPFSRPIRSRGRWWRGLWMVGLWMVGLWMVGLWMVGLWMVGLWMVDQREAPPKTTTVHNPQSPPRRSRAA
ncbi:MAG: hypothetical protein ACI8UO_004811, partial [Verrucomicrobiales bacterium]